MAIIQIQEKNKQNGGLFVYKMADICFDIACFELVDIIKSICTPYLLIACSKTFIVYCLASSEMFG